MAKKPPEKPRRRQSQWLVGTIGKLNISETVLDQHPLRAAAINLPLVVEARTADAATQVYITEMDMRPDRDEPAIELAVFALRTEQPPAQYVLQELVTAVRIKVADRVQVS